MGTDIVPFAAVAVAGLLAVVGLVYWLVRQVHKCQAEPPSEYHNPNVTIQTFRVKDPLWKTDAHGRYLEMDEGQRLYWSKGFDPDDVST